MLTTRQKIHNILKQEFAPEILIVTDNSDEHIGHAGSSDGKGHYTVELSCAQLRGLSRIQSHRLIYAALEDLMQNEIHALRIIFL